MRCKSPIDIYISKLDATAEHTITSKESRREEVLHNPNSLRRSSYVSINPKLSVHTVYRKSAIAEFKCKVFSWLGVGFHRLRIEMGRWSRVPWDERLYPCGSRWETYIVRLPILPWYGKRVYVRKNSFREKDILSSTISESKNWKYLTTFFYVYLLFDL